MFCINDGSKRYKNNEKGSQKIENHEEIWYKILQNCQVRDLVE